MTHAIRGSLFILLTAHLYALNTNLAHSADEEEIAPGTHVEAIWHVQQTHFRFRSTRMSYACDELERKVANILRALGARKDVAVDSGCFDGQFVSAAIVQVTLATPVPATAENLRRATTFDGRDGLLARMHGRSLPTAADIQRFPATWRRISLQRDRVARVEQVDCDLLTAMTKHVFPKLAVRVDEKRFSCSSLTSRVRPRVEVAALMPIEVAPVVFVAH